jgi:oligogalacturonide transport system permease protein
MKLKRKDIYMFLWYLLLIAIGVMMIYPFLWLVGSSFKTTYEIFADPSFIPKRPSLNGYINGWRAAGGATFTTFFKNTYIYVVVKVLATVFAAIITAYGFSRFNFFLKKQLMAILIATLLFPGTVILVPSYLIFTKIGWVDSYLPLVIPSLFAGDTFFVFMMIQFFRTLPRDMDEAAMIDGCGPIRRLISILIPLLKPAIITVILFQFIWTGNEFLGPMIYLSSEYNFPVAVGLKLSLDGAAGVVAWENTMAMSVVAIIPSLIAFICAQRHFVEGISTSGLKG